MLWWGLIAPAKLPAEIAGQIEKAFAEAAGTDKFKAAMEKQGGIRAHPVGRRYRQAHPLRACRAGRRRPRRGSAEEDAMTTEPPSAADGGKASAWRCRCAACWSRRSARASPRARGAWRHSRTACRGRGWRRCCSPPRSSCWASPVAGLALWQRRGATAVELSRDAGQGAGAAGRSPSRCSSAPGSC